MTSIELNVAKWFTGKALANATEALNLLNESMELGYWVGRASVKVPAALAKSNVAKKASKTNSALNAIEKDYSHAGRRAAWEINHNLYFGSFRNMADVDFDLLEGIEDVAAIVSVAKEFVNDFKGIVEAIDFLNKESKANKTLAESKDGNPVGICACCFRAQKVMPSGTMYNHGYLRPGYGYIVGGCPGSEFPPYSVRT